MNKNIHRDRGRIKNTTGAIILRISDWWTSTSSVQGEGHDALVITSILTKFGVDK